jgi:exosortase
LVSHAPSDSVVERTRWRDGADTRRSTIALLTGRWPLLAATVAFLAAFGWVYAGILRRLVSTWSANPDYSHGFVVVPIAAYLLYDRRARLVAAPKTGSWTGLVVIGLSLIVLLAGLRGAELFLSRASMIGVIAGVVLFVWGGAVLRVCLFPLAFLLLMIPLPTIVFNQITMPLQLLASRVAERTLDLAGVPVLREGNVVLLPYATLEVVEACSGIRSIVSLLALAIVLAQFTNLTVARRWLLAVATLPLAVVANGLRVAVTGLASAYWGTAAAEGFVHTASGWLMFVGTFCVLLVMSRWLEPRPQAVPARTTEERC